MEPEEVVTIIVLGTFLILIFCFSIILFFMVYMKNKKLHLQNLHNEVLKAEIQSVEKTSNKISVELHDDVAQYLGAACILLQEKNLSVDQLSSIFIMVDTSIEKLRNISHNLIANHVTQIELIAAIKKDISVYQKLKNTTISFISVIEKLEISNETQLMVYRIFQETMSNAFKHSGASEIVIKLNKLKNLYTLEIIDNGKGYDTSLVENSSNGLLNMKNRAEIIKAKLLVYSAPNKQTGIQLIFS